VYDEEQCACYYQDYIEERNRDIRKQLDLRSQPAKALTKAQQMGEGNAATKRAKRRTSDGGPDHYHRDGTTAQGQKNKDDKMRKEIAKPNHTVEWIQEWLTLLTQLDGTGGHERLSKMA
jgi:hypothetical protein